MKQINKSKQARILACFGSLQKAVSKTRIIRRLSQKERREISPRGAIFLAKFRSRLLTAFWREAYLILPADLNYGAFESFLFLRKVWKETGFDICLARRVILWYSQKSSISGGNDVRKTLRGAPSFDSAGQRNFFVRTGKTSAGVRSMPLSYPLDSPDHQGLARGGRGAS